MKVSVIIPVYNVEKYLKRCLNSVLCQTYRNLEIIIVDDGSEDYSGMICDNICETDKRIVVIHKKNGGLSSARNMGLEIATGHYITFVDSDDYIALDFIEKTLDLCEDKKADIAIMQMLYISEDINEEMKQGEKNIVEIFDSQRAIEESLYQKRYSCCTPGKLYKRHVFDKIRFPEGRLSEDLATCHLLLDAADKIVYSNEIGYYYRQHNSSIMHIFNPRRMDALEWSINIEQFCEEKYPNIIPAALCRTFNVSIHLLLELPEKGEMYDRYFVDIWNEIKRTRIPVILCHKVRFREQAAAILSFAGLKMLKCVWNSKIAIKKTEG
ncbi:glycosyltransferase family 2 protein [Lacrimispora sp. 210928-DFI.3.58]|uniref:glycosyltransferase family 2 protein n=1 Tax=Lacrimispora sp. 210928-DFI.3.58 TaxID=2883214 RepID=UPI001D07B731|nr:glycosyltransferase family 2 protein [Lacrimispora sp. 210928-DFI.3.58]MCB7320747.1 glycosyltransferase [Lacrimispora sp. 210928-DFI.3.58]